MNREASGVNLEAYTILENICTLYQKNAEKFYGNSSDGKSRINGRYNFKELAKNIFDPIDTKEFPKLYVDLFETIPFFTNKTGVGHLGCQKVKISILSVPELILNLILPYQLPSQQKVAVKEKDEEEKSDSGEKLPEEEAQNPKKKRKNSTRKVRTVSVPSRVTIDIDTAKVLLKKVLVIPLNAESKLWKQIRYVLVPSANPTHLKELGPVIAESAKTGVISFAALSFFMKDQFLSEFLADPKTILHSLYIGPISADTIEHFAANRSDDFRMRCREILRSAIQAQKDPISFRAGMPQNLSETHPERRSYKDFVFHTTQVLKDLNGEYQGDSAINAGWACAAIKKFGKKTYIDKTWREENFYDLIWTVMCQRPHLKKFICEVLDKQFHDQGASRFWRRMQPQQMDRHVIFNRNICQIDPLMPMDEFLNFPRVVRSIKVVTTPRDLSELHRAICMRMELEKPLIVGLDAEWSAYVSNSGATILQLALRDSVYIIDVESRHFYENELKYFFAFLFSEERILKIGFQFGEDLHQLRAVFRTCQPLYHPTNVICVGKLISELLEKLDSLPDSAQRRKSLLPYFDIDKTPLPSMSVTSDEGEGVANVSVDSDVLSDSVIEEPHEGEQKKEEESAQHVFLNKGLSFICEKLLGRPLDKTEQCSVWDRRPLRPLQIRYAAMDAYCMIMLFDVCKNIADNVGVNFDEVVARQAPISVSLPLLSEHPL